MNQSKYLIKVITSELEFITKVNYYHIKIKRIKNNIFLINQNDYHKLTSYFPNIELLIIKDYSVKGLIKTIKNKIFIIILLSLFGISYFLITNLIIRIDINTNDLELKNNIKVSLKNNDIKPFSLKKRFSELNTIKNDLLTEYQADVEWLEIKNVGMTYQVSLVKRIKNDPKVNSEYCNVYAKKEGLITRAIYNHGELLVNQNNLVKKGDLLISGNIVLNDEVKAQVCASGKVYAEVWYTISLKIPRIEEDKIISKKKKYNLYYNDYNLLNHQFKTYDVTIIKKIKDIKLVREDKITYQKRTLSEAELLAKADQIIKNKLDINLNKDYDIISQKVLKKSLNDSTMDIVVFISVEENIANQIIEMKE